MLTASLAKDAFLLDKCRSIHIRNAGRLGHAGRARHQYALKILNPYLFKKIAPATGVLFLYMHYPFLNAPSIALTKPPRTLGNLIV